MTDPAPAAARETEGRPRSEAGDSCEIAPPHGAPVGVAGAPPLPCPSSAFIASQTHPLKARWLQIVLVVWPHLADRSVFEAAWLLGQIGEVEAGHGTPTLSRKEHEAIEAEILKREAKP